MKFSAGFLGLGRPTALALLAFSLQLAKVFRASLGDLLPTLPSKLDGGGILFVRQNSEVLALVSHPYYARRLIAVQWEWEAIRQHPTAPPQKCRKMTPQRQLPAKLFGL